MDLLDRLIHEETLAAERICSEMFKNINDNKELPQPQEKESQIFIFEGRESFVKMLKSCEELLKRAVVIQDMYGTVSYGAKRSDGTIVVFEYEDRIVWTGSEIEILRLVKR